MNNINNLTYANLTWIRDKAIPTSKLRITQEHLDIVLRAKSLILGIPQESTGCFSCNARAYFKVAESVLDQYKQQILDKIAELETAEFSQTFYVVDNDGENGETLENNALDLLNSTLDFEDYEGDVMVEKIVSMESTENEISVTTKRGRKKNEI